MENTGIETAKKMATQMISVQKTVFENSFNTIKTAQDQSEKMYGAMLDKMPWINDDSRKWIDDAIDNYKNVRNDFKKTIDQQFEQMEALFRTA